MVEQKALDAIARERMLDDGGAVLAAVSGGADSMALLQVLLRLAPSHGWRVGAAHVHHGLRGAEADRDEAFVRERCAAWGVPLFVRRADVAAEAAARGEGLEEAGRRVRYAFFDEVCAREGFDRVATAHTASDNVETLLLHMARGCALGGLCGIRPVWENRIRPLLDCSREEIEAYCRERGIPFVTDSTNADPRYSRNRLRREAVPALRAVNPRLEDAVARLARSARRDEAYLEERAAELLGRARREADAYDRRMLRDAHEAIGMRALALALDGAGAEERHLRAVYRLLSEDGVVNLPGDRRARSKGGRLIVEPAKAADAAPFEPIALRPGECCEICGRNYRLDCLSLDEYEKKKKVHKNLLKSSMNYAKIVGNLVARRRLPADAYHPAGRQGGKSLKKLFNEAKTPLEERETTPVLCDGEGIVLVPGFGCDERVKLDADTDAILIFVERESDGE